MYDKKVFPIHNSAACVFKWGWNTFRLYSGKTSSCHRVESEFVDIENFDNFHNMPAVLKDREQMKKGQWPDSGRGCEYCHRVEEQQGESDRTYHNKIVGLTPVDFDMNDNNVVTPRIAEIYFDNTCDLSCVYCSPVFSSRLNNELKTFGPYPIGVGYEKKHTNHQLYLDKYKNWLETNYHKILRFSILGGEPLLQKEFWEMLDFMDTHPNPEIEISINTNLNADIQTVEKFVAKVKQLVVTKKIRRFIVIASLDCWGPQSEFIRYGLSLDNWKKNFEFLMTHKWINLSVHQVITSLSLSTMADLQKLIGQYKKTHPKIIQSYHMVDSGQELIYHPEIFGADFFREDFKNLIETFPIETDWDNESKKRLEGFLALQESSSIDKDRLLMLKQTLDQLDTRRNTNWRSLFSHIDKYFLTNGI